MPSLPTPSRIERRLLRIRFQRADVVVGDLEQGPVLRRGGLCRGEHRHAGGDQGGAAEQQERAAGGVVHGVSLAKDASLLEPGTAQPSSGRPT